MVFFNKTNIAIQSSAKRSHTMKMIFSSSAKYIANKVIPYKTTISQFL